MSASGGMLGGARAQYQLRQVFVFLNMFPLNKPEVIIPEANKKIDAEGNVTDEYTKEKIKELVEALVNWTIKLQPKVSIPKEVQVEHFPYENAYSQQVKGR